MPLQGVPIFLALLLLLLATIPLGSLLLRGIERFCGRPFQLSILERILIAPYLAVALLFVLASVPVPLVGFPLVVGLLIGGLVGLFALWIPEHFATPRNVVKWLWTIPGMSVLLGTLALLILEFFSAGTHPFPNSYDGSYQSLYIKLIVANHTIPWTLQPYTGSGVIYPQGAAVWMTLPILLLGLPIQTSPVVLPPVFLGLSGAAAFCWGHRLGGFGTQRGNVWGLVFAGFYGLVASWPRLFVGGSYDFVFGLPLFLVCLGWLRPFVESCAGSWRNVFAFGGLLGISTSLSLAAGEALALLLLAWIVVYRAGLHLPARQWLARVTLILGMGAAFVLRSILGVAIWFAYPGHVLSEVGNPPEAPTPGLPMPTSDTLVGELDPFVPFKWKLSPLVVVSLELTVLLSIGLALFAIWWVFRRIGGNGVVPKTIVVPVAIGTFVLFVWTLLLVVTSGVPLLAPIFDSLASLYEASFLLFIFYQTVALIPLIVTADWLLRRHDGRKPSPIDLSEPRRVRGKGSKGKRSHPTLWGPRSIGVAALLVTPLLIGAGSTVADVPTFLSSHLSEFSNVSGADVNALTWAGIHLPDCSQVLVAPGSAGLFLPLYATVHLDFPMMPLSVNLSYTEVVNDLVAGSYTMLTKSALLYLGITEIFVTGQTSISYPTLLPQPMLNSSDFSLLFHDADAYMFGFLPVLSVTVCSPR